MSSRFLLSLATVLIAASVLGGASDDLVLAATSAAIVLATSVGWRRAQALPEEGRAESQGADLAHLAEG